MGALISRPHRQGRRRDANALRRAVTRGDLPALRTIAERSPSALTSVSFFKRRTLLHLAVRSGNDSNSRGRRTTNTLVVSTLLWAAEEFLGSSDAYAEFLNARDLFGNTALHLACKVRTVAATTVVRMLLEEGADPLVFNRRGNSCLHVAAAYCNASCLQIILDTRRGGANLSQTTVNDRIGDVPFVDALNFSGLSALHIAALTTNHAAVGALVDRGAQLDSGVARGLDNLPYLCGGSTALHIAASLGDVRSVMVLLQAQWRVHGLELRRLRNIVGLTPVNCALLMGYHSVVRVLVDTPRREMGAGGLTTNERRLNSSLLSETQNAEFASGLRDHMNRVLQKATLLVTLRDISLHWRSQGEHQRSTCEALDGIQLSTLSLLKIGEMQRLLENEEASLRDILFGFERVLYGGGEGGEGAVQVAVKGPRAQGTGSGEDEDEDECSLCLDNKVEVMFQCEHRCCFECAARLCIRGQADITCPFCRSSITGILALATEAEEAVTR